MSYQQYQQSQPLQMDEDAATGILKHLSVAELQQLLDSDDKLNGLIADMPQVGQNLRETSTVYWKSIIVSIKTRIYCLCIYCYLFIKVRLGS